MNQLFLKLEDSENHSPLENYKRGKFPWIFINHLLLAILGACQIIFILSKITDYSRQQQRLFYKLFLNDSDMEGVDGDYDKKKYIYSIEELKSYISNSVDNFFTIKDKSLEKIEYHKEHCTLETDYIIHNINNSEDYHISKSDYKTESIQNKHEIIKLTQNNLGPFSEDDDKIRENLKDITKFQITYKLKTYVPSFYKPMDYECFHWVLSQVFDFKYRGHITVTLSTLRKTCGDNDYWGSFIEQKQWVNFLCLISASFNFFYVATYFSKIITGYLASKKLLSKKLQDLDISYSKTDESHYFNPLFDLDENIPFINEEKILDQERNDIPLTYKRKVSYNEVADNIYKNQTVAYESLNNLHENSLNKVLSNKVSNNPNYNNKNTVLLKPKRNAQEQNLKLTWSIISALSCIFLFIASVILLFNITRMQLFCEIFVGMGSFLAWTNMGRYLEYNIRYSQIYMTIGNSMKIVIKYIVGVLPIFIAFILLGCALFWRSDDFSSPHRVMMTLFSLSQGDSVYDIFYDLGSFGKLLGYSYLYAFSIFFMIIVTNIFIAIIEEAYCEVKMKYEDHWVFDYMNKGGTDNFQRTKKKFPDKYRMDKIQRSEDRTRKFKILESVSF